MNEKTLLIIFIVVALLGSGALLQPVVTQPPSSQIPTPSPIVLQNSVTPALTNAPLQLQTFRLTQAPSPTSTILPSPPNMTNAPTTFASPTVTPQPTNLAQCTYDQDDLACKDFAGLSRQQMDALWNWRVGQYGVKDGYDYIHLVCLPDLCSNTCDKTDFECY